MRAHKTTLAWKGDPKELCLGEEGLGQECGGQRAKPGHADRSYIGSFVTALVLKEPL